MTEDRIPRSSPFRLSTTAAGEPTSGVHSREAVGLKVDRKPHDWAAYSPRVLRGSPAWPTNPFLMGFGDGRDIWRTTGTICGL
jgi:hypothetical protein